MKQSSERSEIPASPWGLDGRTFMSPVSEHRAKVAGLEAMDRSDPEVRQALSRARRALAEATEEGGLAAHLAVLDLPRRPGQEPAPSSEGQAPAPGGMAGRRDDTGHPRDEEAMARSAKAVDEG